METNSKVKYTKWAIVRTKGKDNNFHLHKLDNEGNKGELIATMWGDAAHAAAEKIEVAVNNTYGKGINPEGVSELVEAANRILELINRAGIEWGELAQLESALRKSIL